MSDFIYEIKDNFPEPLGFELLALKYYSYIIPAKELGNILTTSSNKHLIKLSLIANIYTKYIIKLIQIIINSYTKIALLLLIRTLQQPTTL